MINSTMTSSAGDVLEISGVVQVENSLRCELLHPHPGSSWCLSTNMGPDGKEVQRSKGMASPRLVSFTSRWEDAMLTYVAQKLFKATGSEDPRWGCLKMSLIRS